MAKKKTKTTVKRKKTKKKTYKKRTHKKRNNRKKHWWQKQNHLPGWIRTGFFIVFSAAVLSIIHHYVDIPLFQTNRNIAKPEITEDYLTINNYSRPGISIGKVNGIVIHYVANPGSSAKENRDYFEGLQDTHVTKASSHYVIGLEGEIIACIPLDEISYASNGRNGDTISIECCHMGEDGKFNDKTYQSLLDLTVWLCEKYDISSDNVIRHYDVTGKLCPLYYVEHEDKWEDFQQEIEQKLKNY